MTRFIESNDPRISDPGVSLSDLQAQLPSDADSRVIVAEEGVSISVTVPGYWSEQFIPWEVIGGMESGHNRFLKFVLGSVYNTARRQSPNKGPDR